MKNAICYYRVSSDRQARDNTIESQKRECQNYVKYQGLEIMAEFQDEGISGAVDNRPGIMKMLECLARNKTKGNKEKIAVVIQDISRLARDVGLFSRIRKDIESFGGELHLVNRKTEDTPEGRFMDNIEAANAQYQRDSNKVKTRVRMRVLLEMGYYQFLPPLGLKRDRDSHNQVILVRDEPRASVICEAFERYAAGEFATKHEVALFLRNSGAFDGVKLTDTKVGEMLKNEVYTGIFAYEPWEIPRQEWKMEKLIPVELFQAVQARMQRNGRTPRHTDNALDFPLTGVIYCEHCGWPLTGYYAKGHKGKLHPYYRCHNKACEHNKRSIRRDMIENAFLERLHTAWADDAVLDLFEEVLNRVCKTKEHDNDASRQKIRADIATLDTRISSIGGLVADAATKGDGALVDLYQGQLLTMTTQKKELESQLDAMPPLSTSEKFRTAVKRGRSFFKKPGILWKIGTLPQKKRLVRMLFIDKPRWSAENGFRTAAMPRIFNKNTAQTDGESFLAVQIELNANEIMAEIINIAEMLTDADIALCAGDSTESTKAANMSAFYIPNHTLTE